MPCERDVPGACGDEDTFQSVIGHSGTLWAFMQALYTLGMLSGNGHLTHRYETNR